MNYRMDAARELWGRTFPKLISAAGPWKTMEFPTANDPSAKDGSREVSMSPAVPKVQRPVRLKWHLRRQGHWKGQKEQIGGAGIKRTMVSLTLQVKS